MAYSLYHFISTTLMENNATLDCLESYLKGEDMFSKDELLNMIKSVKKLNEDLHVKSNMVIQDIKKEVF